MSVYNDIISGTYNKKKRSIADEIINGTYQQNQEELQKATNSILDIKNKRNNAFQNVFSKKEDKNILPTISPTINNRINTQNTVENKGEILPKIITDEKLLKKPNENQTSDLFPTLLAGVNYFGQGAMKGAEGLLDTAIQLGTSKLNPYYWFNADKLENHQQIAKEIIQKDATRDLINGLAGDENFNQNVLDKNSMIKEINIGGGIAKSLGQMSMSLATGNENIGLGLMGIQSYGGGLEEAYNQGATRSEANRYGLMNAAIETASEKMFSGIGGFVGKGPLDDTIKKKLTKNVSNAVTKRLVEAGIDMIGEGVEELASDLLQPIAQKLTYANEEDLLKLYQDQNYLEDFVSGALSAGVLQGITLPSQIKAINNQSQNQVVPLPKLNKDNVNIIKQDVANNQNINYNTNEGDINGRISSIIGGNDRGRIGNGISTQKMEYGTDSKNVSQRRINKSEFGQFEQQAREKTKTNLTSNEQKFTNEIKQQYNKNVAFFDGELSYNAGASITDPSLIFISSNVSETAQKFMTSHEILESNIYHNKLLSNEYIKPTIYDIMNDNSFQEAKESFIQNEDLQNASDYAIAKDLLCDIYANKKTGLPLSYENKLSPSIMEEIDYAIDKFDMELSKQNSRQIVPLPTKIDNIQQKKNSATGSDANIPKLTSETNSGTSSLDSNIAQYENSVKLPYVNNMQQNEVNMSTYKDTQKTMNPNEISQLTPQDANTTPVLPIVKRNTNSVDSRSSFYENATKTSQFLSENSRSILSLENDIQYYKSITNEESLKQAKQKLDEGGSSETLKWFQQDSKKATATDIAEGWILMKQYQDIQDYDSMVEVAKKMREIGTNAGQTVQAFNIMERLTPEGMVKYAQSELSEAFERMSKNKTKEWIDKHRAEFDLQPNEVQFIVDNMNEIQTMEDGYDKRVKLAEIQKLMTDKLPPTKGAGIKSWMRISMLFNPKTQVRNVVGNAIIAPVNYFGDIFSSYADKLIAKKTGVRTTGNMNVKTILKGFKEGAYEATNDYRKGINTKDMEGNRFEIGEGKSFNDKKLIGRSLNRVEGLLNYVMDAGDRMFSQSSFENSLQNQMILNNTTEITQDMIDIARTESLQRTWNDNNNYTKFVLDIRRMLNKVGTQNYGLGDVLIPFAKTPANLTKAIVDYSPVGLVTTLIEGNNLRKSLTNGQYTSKMQHKFVQDLGKATAGTMLYILGYALAKAGVISGESDDDKDVANFMKNTLGISSYSIKIGNKTFSYDWAQPLAAPLSITANIVKREKENASLLDAITSSLDEGFNVILEQSFFESINNVFSDPGKVPEKIGQEILNLPARAIPTFSKQIADMVDGTQRTSYEYGKPVESAINSIKVKIPGLSKTVAPSVDTMGREIKKYGGKNNIFNVFLNPANVNTENISESAEEIYRLYKETGETNIMPRVAPYYINKSGEKIILDSKQRAEFQKISGDIIEKSVQELLKESDYKNMADSEKVDMINDVVNYSYNKAREEVLNLEMSNQYNKINQYIKDGGKVSDYYLNKEEIDYSYDNPEKYAVIKQITSYDKYNQYYKELNHIRENTSNKKSETLQYINNLKLNIPQKAMMIKMYYPSYNDYNEEIINYINKQKGLSVDDKTTILTKLGFTVRNGKVIA